MDSVKQQTQQKRKTKTTELEVLVQEENNHILELQQRNITVTWRNAIWEAICDKVNAVKDKDIRRRTKEKTHRITSRQINQLLVHGEATKWHCRIKDISHLFFVLSFQKC